MDALRTPTQMFILIAGLFHIAFGAAGFVGPWIEGSGAAGEGELFGFIAINGTLSVLNLVFGSILVVAALSIPISVLAARIYAGLFAVLAIWGVIEVGLVGDANALIVGGSLHVNVVSNWLFIALTALYALFGFVPQMWRTDVVESGERRDSRGEQAYNR